MSEEKKAPLCEVELIAENGRWMSCTVNGQRMRTIRIGGIAVESDGEGPPILKLDLHAIDLRLKGQMRVELVNVPEGNALHRDDTGRLWFAPCGDD